jgi:hypothetical protein
MTNSPAQFQPPHPHDVGLPPQVVRKRHKNRFLAHWMLALAVLTGGPGWVLYYFSVRMAQKSPLAEIPTLMVIGAYALLIISTIALILGMWYLLLAQVRRIATMVGEEEVHDAEGHTITNPHCANCGWNYDAPDRFCRHCGKPLATGETGIGK